MTDNDRNQRTGGGRGQIARHSTPGCKLMLTAHVCLLMDASPFGVSMCNALIFFFSFPGRGTGQRAAHWKVRRWVSYMYPPSPAPFLPSVSPAGAPLTVFVPPSQATFDRKDLVKDANERTKQWRQSAIARARSRTRRTSRRAVMVCRPAAPARGVVLIGIFFTVCVWVDSHRHDTSLHRV